MINSTISGNSATESGGGIYNGLYENQISSPVATLINCTISGNSCIGGSRQGYGTGGGIYNNAAQGKVILANTIVAGNSASTGGDDVLGPIDSLGHNLIGKDSDSTGWRSSDLTGTDKHPLNAKLGSLGNHGGFTQTMLPLAASPAIGAGSIARIPSGITTDQRGFSRILDGEVDIGAIEVQ